MKNKLIASLLLFVVFAISSFAQENKTTKKKPNIIVIISDDQEMNTIGAYGSAQAQTPNIDRLASEGMVHTRAYTTASLCIPTRYSCLTGQYASRSRYSLYQPMTSQAVIANGTYFVEDTKTIAQALQKEGYFTVAVGKWHNMAHERNAPNHPSNITANLPKNADPKDPQVISQLKAAQHYLKESLKHYGFDYAECLVDGNLESYPSALDHHNVEYTVRGAVDFLDEAPKDQPFFLWTAFTTTHGPREKITSASIHMTAEGYSDRALGVMPSREEILKTVKKKGNVLNETVTWMDAGVGAILDKLTERGQAENTLVIFLSDQQNLGKSTPYESGSNIPFIARWPAVIEPNTKNSTLFDVTDMAATVMAIAEAQPLEGMHLDGLNLLPVWEGKKDVLKSHIFTEMGHTKAIIGQKYKYIAIRYDPTQLENGFVPPTSGSVPELAQSGQLKGLRKETPFGQSKRIGIMDPDQLYDLSNDPNETKNLAYNPEYKEILNAMKSELSKEITALRRSFGEFQKK
jgi:arylsulfatase A-like enzyme